MTSKFHVPADVKAKVEAFDKLHGGPDDIYCRDGEWILYGDGAMRERNPWGPLLDPPADPIARQKIIVACHRARFSKARAEFEHAKDALEQNTQYGDRTPTDEELASLETLYKRAKAIRRVMNLAEAELTGLVHRTRGGNLVVYDLTTGTRREMTTDEVERFSKHDRAAAAKREAASQRLDKMKL